jgi:ABC-type transport system involved in multi-copper enzyme maturation permease subunit
MVIYEWIEKMPAVLRWIVFLPSVFIVYGIMGIVAAITIRYGFGPETDDFLSFIGYKFYYDFISIGFSLTISCLIVPKGRLLVASIYLAIILILSGIGISNTMNGADENVLPLWKIIYELVMTIGGYIFAFVMVKFNEKELRKKHFLEENSIQTSETYSAKIY